MRSSSNCPISQGRGVGGETLDECERFRDGRIVFEAHMQNWEHQEFLKEQKMDLVLSERDVSDLIDRVVEIVFLKYQPQVVAIMTSPLLNATGKAYLRITSTSSSLSYATKLASTRACLRRDVD
ncbi:unnamed protein product [Heligmosomoides polygyrus]|uniref:LysR_substrate domain-containing protein n=1 Tax=Heligmosomoides polygyrus TaxID=6339 RepID=A0A183F441_HELPZ|nr:unnamed protein product [Heligmosomoides polygyrus]